MFCMKDINMEDDEITFNYNVLKNYEIASCIQNQCHLIYRNLH